MASSSVLALEHPLVKVPLETLNKAFRATQRHLEKESAWVQSRLDELVAQAGRQTTSRLEAAMALGNVVCRLNNLKRKLEESFDEEEKHAQRGRARLEHINVPEAEQTGAWAQTRINRIIVDHLLRQGFYNTATSLAANSHIEDLCDTAVFLECKKVEDALDRHDSTEPLAWCFENRSRLRKLKSTLEFNLRVQELIELARKGRGLDAVAHARRYLAPFAESNLKEVQAAMGVLAYDTDSTCPKYQALFDPRRWEVLKAQFRHDHYGLHNFTTQSLLVITLQVGLSALKTRMCYQPENRSPNCPVCGMSINELAEKLPFSHRQHSTLVCRVTGDVMWEHNPPMALPNGYVYSLKGLQAVADHHNGYVTCPRTHERYHVSELKKVFIM